MLQKVFFNLKFKYFKKTKQLDYNLIMHYYVSFSHISVLKIKMTYNNFQIVEMSINLK